MQNRPERAEDHHSDHDRNRLTKRTFLGLFTLVAVTMLAKAGSAAAKGFPFAELTSQQEGLMLLAGNALGYLAMATAMTINASDEERARTPNACVRFIRNIIIP
ncbi:MAG TPA: hypothetical protein DCY07_06785 [Rhodospirillaceae bacterium]|nr:hypothetical protein [Rhodospirillaceae bacterium]